MRHYTLGRDRIIDYLAFHGAMPVLHRSTGEPSLLRAGEPEADWRRVGWPEFFKAAEDRHYAFVWDDTPGTFDWKFMDKREARRLVGVEHSSLMEHVKATLRLGRQQHA